MNEMVSVVILVRDDVNFLKRCIDTIMRNTWETKYEMILIIQGRVGQPVLDYLDFISKVDNCKIIYNETNTGVTPGRIQGMQEAHGTHILFFDDDAWVSEELTDIPDEEKQMDWLHRMLQYFSKPDVGIVSQSGSYIDVKNPGMFWGCKGRGEECDVGQGYCFMFSREVMEKIGFLDPEFGKFWHEESEYALRAKFNGFKVINTCYIGVTHYGSGSGDDGSYGRKIKYMFDKWSKHFNQILVPRERWVV